MIEISMAQEEHTQKYSNSSSGGGGGGDGGGSGSGGFGSRSSKKLKQKKVPQRGLGVAQLEKIRLEEQQKKDAAVQAASAILPPKSIMSPNSSCLAVQCANFRHNPSPSSPLPPPSPTHFSSKNAIFRPVPLIPNLDALHPNSGPFSKPSLSNIGDGEIGWLPNMGSGNGNWSKLWNCEYNLDGENHRMDHHGFTFRSNMNVPYEPWPPQSVMHRAQQFQQPSSSSMVNVSSGTTSSSVMNLQIEPPSNQSYYSNNYTNMCPEEERMIGMKRPYPFSLDNPATPSFQCKFPATYPAPVYRSDESASCGNGGASNIEPGNPVFRECHLSSATMYEPNPEKISRGNGTLNGDFLTLAPPTATSPHGSSKYKASAAYVVPYCRDLTEVEPLPPHYQGSMEEPIHRQGPGGLIQQQPFYNFFLTAKAQIGQAASTVGNCTGDIGGVDLNLKL